MKKFFLSLVSSLFVITVYAQNPVYNNHQERPRVFELENGISVVKLNENQLLPASGSEQAAGEKDFIILTEDVSYTDFTVRELQQITANRQKKYSVKTALGRKIILISPAN
ncbi:MAG: hypothetical protein K0R65_1111 [Crocinitomicaceae bacterium]|jgi:hypothetical protein|nr:hypothetical protein [Crocinitomicaceae bacterium]